MCIFNFSPPRYGSFQKCWYAIRKQRQNTSCASCFTFHQEKSFTSFPCSESNSIRPCDFWFWQVKIFGLSWSEFSFEHCTFLDPIKLKNWYHATLVHEIIQLSFREAISTLSSDSPKLDPDNPKHSHLACIPFLVLSRSVFRFYAVYHFLEIKLKWKLVILISIL